jgi:hypothetical protein
MSLLSKLRVTQAVSHAPLPTAPRSSRGNSPLHAPAGPSGPVSVPHNARFSNGLKEFLWQLDGVGRGRLLDLGPAWQATLNFFIDRGFKVYSEDMLTAWRGFRGEEEDKARLASAAGEVPDRAPGPMAERFLASNMNHAADTFDAVLLWDILDYLEPDAAARVLARLTTLVRDGGVVLSVFHTRLPEGFSRYRVIDPQNLELVPTPTLVAPRHIYQNREIQDLFRRFRSSKSFVGRDQLREIVFVK